MLNEENLEQLQHDLVTALRRYVAELDIKRAKAMARLAALTEDDPENPQTKATPTAAVVSISEESISVLPNEFHGMTTDAAVKKLLSSYKVRLAPTAIARILHKGGQETDLGSIKSNVYAALERLKKKGDIIREEGLWRIV
jgi:hypothetical protein